MGSPISVETVVKGKNDHPSVEFVLSPQRHAEFQSASPAAQQNHVSPPTLNPPNVVDESASIHVLTLREIRVIKQQNPAEALQKLQQLRRLSTERHLPLRPSFLPQS